MSNKQKPESQARSLVPAFLDDDLSPLPVPRTAMRHHLNEPNDMNSWRSPDAGLTAITENESAPSCERKPAKRSRLNLTTKKKLDAMFLPELHQARWAQRMGELHDAQRHATTAAAEAAATAEIMAHYKTRHDIEATRQRLEEEYKVMEAAERSKGSDDAGDNCVLPTN